MHLTFKVRLITAPVFCFIKTVSGQLFKRRYIRRQQR